MNDKVKSLFFSQYWGQKVFVKFAGQPKWIFPIDGAIIAMTEPDSYLLLRDISQLTDEEK